VYGFRGQAYVQGIMKYEGDIIEADQACRIRLRDFRLISPFQVLDSDWDSLGNLFHS
jgi:hypothetical protein